MFISVIKFFITVIDATFLVAVLWGQPTSTMLSAGPSATHIGYTQYDYAYFGNTQYTQGRLHFQY